MSEYITELVFVVGYFVMAFCLTNLEGANSFLMLMILINLMEIRRKLSVKDLTLTINYKKDVNE